MKKMIFLMLTLLILSAASMNAQVNIGSVNDPHKGAILDLSQSELNLGLLFPKVYLFSTRDFTLPVDEGVDATGMVIYNNNAGLSGGVGLYFWNGTEWKSMSATPNAGSNSCIPVTATASSTKTDDNVNLKVTITAGSPTFSYTWYKDDAETPVRTVTNASATSDTYTTTEAATYICKVTNACTATPLSLSFIIGSDGSSYTENDNGTYTNDEGKLVVPGTEGLEDAKVYDPVESDIPGFYKDAEGEIVYTGADGIPGTDDDNIYVPNNEVPAPVQKTKVSILYPSGSCLNSNSQYQITLDYADPEDASKRSVVAYLSSNPSLLTINETGLISTELAPARTVVQIVVLLDDGTVIPKSYSIMLPSSFESEGNMVGNVTGIDGEQIVNSIKLLSSTVVAQNLSGNIYDVYTIEYEIVADLSSTGSTVTPGGWFTAGSTAGTVTLKVTVVAPRGGTFTDTFEIVIKEEPAPESVYETSFSGNWLELDAATAYAGGNGTESDPYLISSVRQLKKLSLDVNNLGATETTYQKYFKLTADLDFEGATVPNNLVSSFQGTFEGGGHVIKNLSVEVTNGAGSGGVFGSLSYGVLKNLGRTGGQTTGNGYSVAGLIGSASYSTISNCYNATPMTGTRIVSGIVGGFSNSTVENCYNTAPITATDVSYTYAGGLFGTTNGTAATVKNSYNSGSVTGNERYVGGMVGGILVNMLSLTIENFFNFGTIINHANSNYVGAIIGYNANGSLNLLVSNVRSTPGIVYKNGTTLITPDRMIGSSSASKPALEIANAEQMSADAKYTPEYSRSSAFVTELGNAFKFANGRTPKLAWEK
ncbi:MAG: hypothetical protein LBQ50_02200 [Planctomycetaceae bacterium]|jgi:hypothetical protein|nr:hypothetical protein [Planctomycetaceae bacterium]